MLNSSKTLNIEQISNLIDLVKSLERPQEPNDSQNESSPTTPQIDRLEGSIDNLIDISTHLTDSSTLIIERLVALQQQERQQHHTDLTKGTLQQQQTEFLTQITHHNERLHARSHQETLQHQTEFLAKIAHQSDRIHTLSDRYITRHRSVTAKLESAVWAMGGCVAGLGLAWLVILPHQLDNARGADSEIVKYLSTTEGRLMRRSFTSGNKSLQECVRKGTKKSGKLICQVEIK